MCFLPVYAFLLSISLSCGGKLISCFSIKVVALVYAFRMIKLKISLLLSFVVLSFICDSMLDIVL